MGAHGWVTEIASDRSILLSRGLLITVEAPGYPRHPPSPQLDAVVIKHQFILVFYFICSNVASFVYQASHKKKRFTF